jgi:hypothetical protein
MEITARAWVIRHNDFTNASWLARDGKRWETEALAVEVYDNHFHWSIQAGGQEDQATACNHDNIFDGFA